MKIKRYLENSIVKDALASHKMAIVSGPRQVGKSTLAKSILNSSANYYLYDDEEFRKKWLKSPKEALSDRSDGPVVLDEIHRDWLWKRKVKGLYDQFSPELDLLITGSARLDYYRKGSDSMLGRYFPYRLFPFTVAETDNPIFPEKVFSRKNVSFPWDDLMQLGGFPEPLLGGSEAKAQRWSRLRLDRVVFEDSKDFRGISDYQAFRSLANFIPDRVGSLFSVNSLRGDVGKAYATVRSWTQLLEVLYFTFSIKPYSKKLTRSLVAEPKVYLYDLLRIPKDDTAKRLENLAALHLHKACCFWTDSAQGEFELRFIRTKDKKEVDFLLLQDSKPWMLVECKSQEKEPSKTLIETARILKPKYVFQLATLPNYEKAYTATGVRVINYESFFSGLV